MCAKRNVQRVGIEKERPTRADLSSHVQVWFRGIAAVSDLTEIVSDLDAVARSNYHAPLPEVGEHHVEAAVAGNLHKVAGEIISGLIAIGRLMIRQVVSCLIYGARAGREDTGSEYVVAVKVPRV